MGTDDARLVADPEPRRHRRHRTWPERLTILATFATAVLCLVVAAGLVGAYLVVRQKNVVELRAPSARSTEPPVAIDDEPRLEPARTTTVRIEANGDSASDDTRRDNGPDDTVEPADRDPRPAETAPPSTFPEADPEAKNFLITGADNGSCIDPNSPYADSIGNREGMGERSDTIMVVRVDPAAARAAVLSFPRDLWVEIAGSGSMQRINSAYQRDEPQRLVDTIYEEFGIEVDHYIQFDFCAFKTLVDAVGGVDVPFDYPTRDTHTGLLVERPGCVNLNGEEALAYVRSRYYEYDLTGDGDWTTDATSDLGRISRQQDFIRRTLATVSQEGLMNPSVIRGLLDASDRYIVTDRQLTPRKVLEFAGVLDRVDPDTIVTYQIESTPRQIDGNSVLIPEIEGERMQQVVAVFRGDISLGAAPADEPAPTSSDQTATSSPASSGFRRPATDTADTTDATTDADTTDAGTTVAASVPDQTVVGIVPPDDPSC